jgi:hypothetical protein
MYGNHQQGNHEGVVPLHNGQTGITNKGGEIEWVQVLNLNQEYWVLYATGEHTALLTWLESPDYNIQMKSG